MLGVSLMKYIVSGKRVHGVELCKVFFSTVFRLSAGDSQVKQSRLYPLALWFEPKWYTERPTIHPASPHNRTARMAAKWPTTGHCTSLPRIVQNVLTLS